MQYRALVAALALFALSATTAPAVEIATARGPVAIAETPKRIVVYDVASVDMLDRLGIKPVGLPKQLYVPELQPLGKDATAVGDLFEPDLEALSGLAPDLIIVGSRSAAKMDAVSAIAPTIDMTITGDDLVEEARQRLISYGRLFDRQDAAQAAVQELDAEVANARAAVVGKGTGLIVMTNGPKVLTYGPGSRFGWVHTALDLPPAVAEIEAATHGETVSFEFIRKANPDWLLVLDRAAAVGSGGQSARATLDNELVAETTAWKKGQVVYLPPADFYIAAGGVQSMQRVMATISKAFAAAK